MSVSKIRQLSCSPAPVQRLWVPSEGRSHPEQPWRFLQLRVSLPRPCSPAARPPSRLHHRADVRGRDGHQPRWPASQRNLCGSLRFNTTTVPQTVRGMTNSLVIVFLGYIRGVKSRISLKRQKTKREHLLCRMPQFLSHTAGRRPRGTGPSAGLRHKAT